MVDALPREGSWRALAFEALEHEAPVAAIWNAVVQNCTVPVHGINVIGSVGLLYQTMKPQHRSKQALLPASFSPLLCYPNHKVRTLSYWKERKEKRSHHVCFPRESLPLLSRYGNIYGELTSGLCLEETVRFAWKTVRFTHISLVPLLWKSSL